MDAIARADAKTRRELFVQTGAGLNLSSVIVEKDFWVCWTLGKLFGLPEIGGHLIFKGGTTLSKVFGIIQRFSEDIDVSISRAWLGFGGENDPEKAGSNKQTKQRIDALAEACRTRIREELQPALGSIFVALLGAASDSGWELVTAPEDAQTLLFRYPMAVSGAGPAAGAGYVRQAVKIELGARSDDWPSDEHSIRPYAADAFPSAFSNPSCVVRVLSAERTFWEKATLLHAEHHRPTGDGAGGADRVSRHYYDLYRMSQHAVCDRALADAALLQRVVQHKRVFFRSGWAHYETAFPGSFHLLPSPERAPALEADYGRMREMIHGEYPPFGEILRRLTDLEARINAMPR